MKVVVADDHPLILEGIRGALSKAEGVEIVGEATEGTQVLPLVRSLSPDLVLLDIRMPKMDGFACLEALRRRHSKVKVVILSTWDDPEYISAALKRGAAAYIVKSIKLIDLPSALRQVMAGNVFHVLGESQSSDQQRREAGLTEREVMILASVAQGLPNRRIATELWITEQTVKFHLTNIFRKLGVTNRTEAVKVAMQLGVVTNPMLESRMLRVVESDR